MWMSSVGFGWQNAAVLYAVSSGKMPLLNRPIISQMFLLKHNIAFGQRLKPSA
jgi:hypothetical protein